MTDGSAYVSWESVYTISCKWVDMLIFHIIYLELCMMCVVISQWIWRRKSECALNFVTGVQIVQRRKYEPHTQVFEWYARIKDRWTFFDDNKHTRRPVSSTTLDIIAKIQQLICENWCQIIHDLPDEAGIGYGSCKQILTTGLGMHCVTAKVVLNILIANQKLWLVVLI